VGGALLVHAVRKIPKPSYFATWEYSELTGNVVLAYWYRSPRGKDAGKIKPWPPRRSSFFKLLHSDVPRLPADERKAWVLRWFAERHEMEWSAILEIEEDPERCSAQFASLQAFCCCCGKGLDDERSVAYGIGPECRSGLSADVITRIIEMVARCRAGGPPSDGGEILLQISRRMGSVLARVRQALVRQALVPGCPVQVISYR
jgi:Family of unknown function (DUF6011)